MGKIGYAIIIVTLVLIYLNFNGNVLNDKIPIVFNSIEITDSNLTPPIEESADNKALELKIHELINEKRQQSGLNTLIFDNMLAEIARKHSEDMDSNNFFSHINNQGQNPSERASAVGYTCRKFYVWYYTIGIAENLFEIINPSPMEDIANEVVTGWMNSPGHRQNILTSTYDREGIGVSTSFEKIYITEDFC